MRRVMENLTGIAAALLLGAGAAQAAPYRVVTDGPDSVWVLDAASGELTWCRIRTAVGAKVIDVFGDEAQARPTTPHRGTPACTVAWQGQAADPRIERAAALFGYRALERDLAYGMGGFYGGGYGYGLDAGDGVTIVRPRTVNVYGN